MEQKYEVLLHTTTKEISYGDLGSMFKRSGYKGLSPLEKTIRIVKELNEFIPTVCMEQGTMFYYFVAK